MPSKLHFFPFFFPSPVKWESDHPLRLWGGWESARHSAHDIRSPGSAVAILGDALLRLDVLPLAQLPGVPLPVLFRRRVKLPSSPQLREGIILEENPWQR